MTIKTREISTFLASQFAVAYHDAMTMYSKRSTFGVGRAGDTPATILNRYLDLCDKTGLRLHNESWEKAVSAMVGKMEMERQAALRQIFHSAA